MKTNIYDWCKVLKRKKQTSTNLLKPENRIIVAAENYSTESILTSVQVLTKFNLKAEQFKLAHIVIDVVDRQTEYFV